VPLSPRISTESEELAKRAGNLIHQKAADQRRAAARGTLACWRHATIETVGFVAEASSLDELEDGISDA
jgi:hypothetical protein